MKFKHLAIVIGMVILFIFAFFLSQGTSPTAKNKANVFENFNTSGIQSIIIRDSNGTLSLTKGKENWQVNSSNNYPADNQKIHEFLNAFKKMKNDGEFEINDELFDRFEVNDPETHKEKSGTKILFYASNEKLLNTIIIGKQADSKEIQYVYSTEKKILAKALHKFKDISTKPSNWLNPYFISPSDILRVNARRDGNSIWTMARNSVANDFGLNLEEKHEVNDTHTNLLESTIVSLQFDDVVDDSISEEINKMPFNHQLRIREKNGLQYTLNFCSESNNIYLKISFDAEITEEVTEEMPEQELKKHISHLDQKIKTLENRFKQWIYVLDKKSFKALFFTIEDLANNIQVNNDGAFNGNPEVIEIKPEDENPEKEIEGPLKLD